MRATCATSASTIAGEIALRVAGSLRVSVTMPPSCSYRTASLISGLRAVWIRKDVTFPRRGCLGYIGRLDTREERCTNSISSR